MNNTSAVRRRTRNTRSGARTALRSGAPRRDAEWQVEPPPDYESGHRMFEQAADLCAQQRGFYRGVEFRDWIESEAEMDRILMR